MQGDPFLRQDKLSQRLLRRANFEIPSTTRQGAGLTRIIYSDIGKYRFSGTVILPKKQCVHK